MIDERRIEKAAKHYAEENSMLIEDQMGDIYNGIEELSDAYKAGAKEAINEFLEGLWHPIREEPEKFRKILYIGDSLDITDTTMLIIDNSWRTKVYLLKIKKWLYIDDLLTKKGGKQ